MTKPANWTSMNGGLKPRKLLRPNINRSKNGGRSASAAVLRTLRTAPRAKIKPRSKKMAARMKEYLKVKEAMLNPLTLCVPCRKLWGTKLKWSVHWATELHHARGRVGSLLTDTRFIIPVCAAGHRAIHEHPEAARKAGLLCKKGDWNKP